MVCPKKEIQRLLGSNGYTPCSLITKHGILLRRLAQMWNSMCTWLCLKPRTLCQLVCHTFPLLSPRILGRKRFSTSRNSSCPFAVANIYSARLSVTGPKKRYLFTVITGTPERFGSQNGWNVVTGLWKPEKRQTAFTAGMPKLEQWYICWITTPTCALGRLDN